MRRSTSRGTSRADTERRPAGAHKATAAEAPGRLGAHLTGDSAKSVEVRPNANGANRVGSSKAWRAAKKMLGMPVPWRFRNGRTFHGGLFWRGMDTGLKAMSGLLSK